MSSEQQHTVAPDSFHYTPSSIVECYSNAFKVDAESTPINIQGIYQPDPANRNYNGFYYDSLTEEGGIEALVMKVKPIIREALLKEKGRLITMVGVLSRKVQTRCTMQILFTPTFVISAQESAISQDEIRLAELTAAKSKRGVKGVKLLITQSLFENRKPTVALLWASQTVVRTEFNNALGIAPNFYQFTNIETTFSNVRETVARLRQLDGKFDMVALIRGGGSNLEVFSNPDLIEAVVNMQSATISAVGHAEEKHHLKKVADLAIDTPTALGKFFSDTLEEVKEARSKSKAILMDEVKKEQAELVNHQAAQIQSFKQQNEKLSGELKTQTEQRTKQNEILSAFQKTVEQKDKDAQTAATRICDLSDKLQKLAENRNKQIEEAIAPLTKEMVRHVAEAETYSKLITEKNSELTSKTLELEQLKTRPQGISATTVFLIAAGTFIAGLLVNLLLS